MHAATPRVLGIPSRSHRRNDYGPESGVTSIEGVARTDDFARNQRARFASRAQFRTPRNPRVVRNTVISRDRCVEAARPGHCTACVPLMLKSPSVALQGRVVVEEAADASRRAVRAFLAMDPDKVSLSAWLVGPYREATRFGPCRIRRPDSDAPSSKPHTTATNIEDLVTMSKTLVIAALEAAQRGIDDLVELLPPVVQVERAHDVYGNHGFIPIDGPRMHLVDRVLALLVADYLTRPDDFQPNRSHTSGTHSTKAWMDLDVRGDGTG
jgi:hypothetical protein